MSAQQKKMKCFDEPIWKSFSVATDPPTKEDTHHESKALPVAAPCLLLRCRNGEPLVGLPFGRRRRSVLSVRRQEVSQEADGDAAQRDVPAGAEPAHRAAAARGALHRVGQAQDGRQVHVHRDHGGVLASLLTMLPLLSCYEQEFEVKRLHSRHRRFIAPGARWDLMAGFEVQFDEAELQFNIVIKYEMDYLFGGTTAFAAAIAAANAAAEAAAAAEEAVELAAIAGITGKRRKKRRVSDDGGFSSILGKRSLDNVLTRSLAEDQIDILGRIEAGMNNAGLAGRQCVLRAICELKETPIHEWSLVGEMITTLLFPKSDNHTQLDDYKEAARLGEEQGDCWSFYPECPFSVFNVIPDVYTETERFNVTFDQFGGGTNFAEDLKDVIKDDEGELPVKEVKIDLDLTPK